MCCVLGIWLFSLLAALSSAPLAATGGPGAAARASRLVASGFPGGPGFQIELPIQSPQPTIRSCSQPRPGRSHNHTYIGNRSVDSSTTLSRCSVGERPASSTPTRPRTGCRPCTSEAEPSSPRGGSCTTSAARRLCGAPARRPHHDRRQRQARRRQPKGIVAWSCGELASGRAIRQSPPSRRRTCSCKADFPNCWNGTSRQPEPQATHGGLIGGSCPASHPVAVPTIALIMLYPPGPAGKSHPAASRARRLHERVGPGDPRAARYRAAQLARANGEPAFLDGLG